VIAVRSSHDSNFDVAVFRQETIDDVMAYKTTSSYNENRLEVGHYGRTSRLISMRAMIGTPELGAKALIILRLLSQMT
jgi:hypothetical protein